MELELRLEKILRQYGLSTHGVKQDIARATGCNRHTVRKLLENTLSNPPLSVIGDICDWLISKGVPADILPRALFGVRPSGLWRALAGRGAVVLYIGEYRQTDAAGRLRRWVAQQDALVLTKVVQFLSAHHDVDYPRPMIRSEYVPYRVAQPGDARRGTALTKDYEVARKIYRAMTAKERATNTIILGSQRVNPLVELLVAETFGCKPFELTAGRRPLVPFFLAYREGDRAVPSCFGGSAPPGLGKRRCTPGIHYVDAAERWQVCPWEPHGGDAGVVIVVRHSGTDATLLAVFGFSGRATEELGNLLVQRSGVFWPPTVSVRGKELGVYIVKFGFGRGGGSADATSLLSRDPEIISLHENTLRARMA